MSEDSTPETLKVIRENLAEYRKKQPEEFEQKNIKINSTEEKQKTTSCSIMTSPWTRLWRKEYDSPANYHDLNPTDDTTPTTERMAEDLEVEIQAERVAKCNQEKSDATTMSNLVDLYINASRNESPLPLNEDSSDASLDLLISRIREDKKEHPEKNVRLEDEKSD